MTAAEARDLAKAYDCAAEGAKWKEQIYAQIKECATKGGLSIVINYSDLKARPSAVSKVVWDALKADWYRAAEKDGELFISWDLRA